MFLIVVVSAKLPPPPLLLKSKKKKKKKKAGPPFLKSWIRHCINRKIEKATCQSKNATKNFEYTTIADRLRTVSWSNDSHPTGVAKPVYGIPTFPLVFFLFQRLIFEFQRIKLEIRRIKLDIRRIKLGIQTLIFEFQRIKCEERKYFFFENGNNTLSYLSTFEHRNMLLMRSLDLRSKRIGVRFPASPLEFSFIGYLLLPSRDMGEIPLERRKSSIQPTNRRTINTMTLVLHFMNAPLFQSW